MGLFRKRRGRHVSRGWQGKSAQWMRPLVAGVMVLLLCICVFGLIARFEQWVVSWELQANKGQRLVAEVLPGAFSVRGEGPWHSLLYQGLETLSGVNSRYPASMVGKALNIPWSRPVAIPVIVGMDEDPGEEDFYLPDKDDVPEAAEDPQALDTEFPPVQLNGAPMVLIYNTHNAESYKPSDGASKLEGKNGGVAAVAKTMTGALESKHGLKTVYSDVIHDYPDFTQSYINSMQTLQRLLKKYTEAQLVLDIHRDAGMKSRQDTLVKIKGQNCAKVMIVVGMEHPRWQQNKAFADKLALKANELYPGLIKSVRALKDRRYNQHLHPRALLLEVGSDLNTRQDALNSAVLMADVIAAVLKGK